jgi:hypothetical protein
MSTSRALTMCRMTDVAYNVFCDSIETQGRALLRVPLVCSNPNGLNMRLTFALQDINDPSLTPPLAVLDHAQILREIMTVYQSSLLGEEDEGERIAGFQKILDIMIDPAIEMCTSTSEEKQRVRPRWDQPVYVLNCLSYLQVCACPSISVPKAEYNAECSRALLLHVRETEDDTRSH